MRAGESPTDSAVQATREGHVVTEWWIATDFFRNGGRAAWGPFKTKDLAFAMRGYVEKVEHPTTYAIDSSRGRCNA